MADIEVSGHGSTAPDEARQVLAREDVVIGLPSTSMEEAIEFVGSRLAERGIVGREYIDGMKLREQTVSTYLGNGVAMPHGTFEVKDSVVGTGIVVAQYPDGVEWGSGTAHLVIGLAAEGDDHVMVLSQMAEVLQDEDLCEQLWTTEDGDLLYATLNAPADEDDDDDEDGLVEAAVVITNPAGLHARPATLIVELAKESTAKVTIEKGGKVAKATSIMSVLALGATTGDMVTVTADAEDRSDAEVIVKGISDILTTDESAS